MWKRDETLSYINLFTLDENAITQPGELPGPCLGNPSFKVT